MTKLDKYEKKSITLITVSGMVFIISVLMLIGFIRYLTNMLKSQAPIDSFGTIDFAVTLVVIFSILVVISVVGIIIGVLKFKRHYRCDLNKEN